MRNIYLIQLFTLFSLTAISQTTYPSGVTGCIARWTFDSPEQPFLSSLPDMSGNNNNGTPYSIATAPGFRDKPYKAGAFDGSTSWAEVADKAMLSSNEMTIISLVKLNNFNNALCESSQIISKGYPDFIAGNYGQCLSDNPYDGACGTFSPNYTQLLTQVGSPMLTVPPGNFVSLNKWYFYASVIGANLVSHYQIEMDSNSKSPSLSPINSIAGTFSIGSNSQNLSIGKHLNPTYPYWVNGSMDELILFNRALSNSEIYSIYSYLWGWATNINEIEKKGTEVKISCINHHLLINSPNQRISKVRIFDISGRVIFECSSQFEKIDLNNINSEILITQVTFEDNSSFFKKIFNE